MILRRGLPYAAGLGDVSFAISADAVEFGFDSTTTATLFNLIDQNRRTFRDGLLT